jgi:hypothetical protein
MQQIKEEIDKAIAQKNELVVDYKRGIYKDSVQFIDVSTAEYVKFEMTIRDAWKAEPVLERPRPEAYIIQADKTELIKKLQTLGVEVEFTDEEKELDVEAYMVTSYSRKPIRYEKMKLQTVQTELMLEHKIFPKGTAIVKMNQRRANLASVILEPEAPNSFVSFGLIETERGQTLPIYRLPN